MACTVCFVASMCREVPDLALSYFVLHSQLSKEPVELLHKAKRMGSLAGLSLLR